MRSGNSRPEKHHSFIISPYYWVIMLVLFFLLIKPAHATSDIPPGFKLIASEPGVRLYRKDYQNGTPDFVQVINLSLGAKVLPLYGEITEIRVEKGSYGGPDPRLKSKPLNKYWQELKELSEDTFCVSNGQFFFMKESPTRLPFPLRVDNQVISDGYGLRDYTNQKLLLLIWPNNADIVPLEKEILYNTTAEHAVAGLTEDARKSPTKYVGRTFVGVDDPDGDGTAEIVLIFSTRSARQKDAASVLRGFGADKVMMFDGGGSAQLICQGETFVASERLIPQALGVLAATDALPHSERIIDDPMMNTTMAVEIDEQKTEEAYPTNGDVVQIQASDESVPPETVSIPTPIYTDNFSDVVWVPVVMLPVMAIVLFVIVRQRISA